MVSIVYLMVLFWTRASWAWRLEPYWAGSYGHPPVVSEPFNAQNQQDEQNQVEPDFAPKTHFATRGRARFNITNMQVFRRFDMTFSTGSNIRGESLVTLRRSECMKPCVLAREHRSTVDHGNFAFVAAGFDDGGP